MKGLPIRQEVQNFLQASDALLSPAVLQSELTPEECLLIADYVMNLSDSNKPWGKNLVSTGNNESHPSH